MHYRNLSYPKDEIDLWRDECGICLSCKEWTSVLFPCCNSGVSYEGGEIWADDISSNVCECDNKGICLSCKYLEELQ